MATILVHSLSIDMRVTSVYRLGLDIPWNGQSNNVFDN
jgi:hypothetical protein